MEQELLNYYNQELSYLRTQGAKFAKSHPKIASRLSLGSGDVEDPFVGRLLEAFAFLTARIHHKIDEGSNHITDNLIHLLYPHYNLPIPSMSIVKLMQNPNLDKEHIIPAKSKLKTLSPDGVECTFQSIYPVSLWPIKIEDITYRKHSHIKPKYKSDKIKSVLSIHLKTTKAGLNVNELNLNRLRFYISADSPYAYMLYELLTKNIHHCIASSKNYDGTCSELEKNSIHFVGFEDDEALLPYPAHSFNGYRLLTEFFAFPRKFLFFDILNLDQVITQDSNDELNLHFFMDKLESNLESSINKDFLTLNATPIINLFEVEGEPIQINHQQLDYNVIADHNTKLEHTEVYAINNVAIHSSKNDESLSIAPYFGKKYAMQNNENQLYWYAHKKPTWAVGAYHTQGFETFIKLSDLSQNLLSHQQNLTLVPSLICSNRNLVEHLPFGGDEPCLSLSEGNEQIEKIHCLVGFSKTKYRSSSQVNSIDLLSHLSLNQIAFDNKESSINVLKETLSLYSYDNYVDNMLINKGLVTMHCEKITARHPTSLKQGFCQGIKINLCIDEKYFPDHNSILFGNILHHFFKKACTINSFTQLILSSKERGEIMQWKKHLGSKTTL